MKQGPTHLYDPITYELLEDPVIHTKCGNTFNRITIEQIIVDKPVCPICKYQIKMEDFTPNRTTLEAVEAYKAKQATKSSPKKRKTVNTDVPTDPMDPIVLSTDTNGSTITVKVTPPEGTVRTPTDVCCVVDVSGSMGANAPVKNEKGETQNYGLSQLDVVKHAVKTVIHTLKKGDRMALVAFDNTARTVFELIEMTEEGRTKAIPGLENLQLGGTTNLWDGLETGLEILRRGSAPGRNRAIMLFTDGMPNVRPPRGEVGMLKKYIDSHNFSATINTFGFGYSLDSALLNELAVIGNGAYAFIPESSMVGTIFVNSLANILSTIGTNAVMSLELLNGTKVQGGPIGCGYDKASWGYQINLGNFNYGQPRTVVLPVEQLPGEDQPYLNMVMRYGDCRTGTVEEINLPNCSDRNGNAETEIQRMRVACADAIIMAYNYAKINDITQARNTVNQLVATVRQSPHVTNEQVKALLGDLEGQVTEAFSREDWYEKWGQHYLPSLARAHLLQQCNNFKDPGVQMYGGKLFNAIQDEADEIFRKLPPPKPSRTHMAGMGTKSTRSFAPIRSMSTYHNSNNPCFHGDCTVTMEDGSKTLVKYLKKGDRVLGNDGRHVTIKCMTRTVCALGTSQLVKLDDGLLVTPYHPIKYEGEWVFPCQVGEVNEVPCEAIYSFVLEGGHSLVINGIEGIALGHGLTENAVVSHEYFGTQRIIDDLSKHPGWEEGLVHLPSGCMVRDPESDRVSGMAAPETEE